MTRASLGAKQVGEQLILDIERYKQHPDCRHLVCLVHDPKAAFLTRAGSWTIRSELRMSLVTVFIVPRQD